MVDELRIAQFKKMAEADPNNELGHFSLGKAYLDGGEYEQALGPLKRAIELAPTTSKAYQLLALAYRGAVDVPAALVTLRKGIEVATQRGDLMPRNQMATLMRELGETPPEAPAGSQPSPAPAPAAPAGGPQITCARCGEAKPKMPERPFKGPLGEKSWANVCGDCWREWIPMGTKVINELRLNIVDPRHAEQYDQHMQEFLGLQQ